jgi:tetratricopeptide (TPR) repeat protein
MDWAGTQNNLGTVLRTLGDRAGDPALLQQAVAAYRAALTVHTPQAAPMDWAMTQNNLAITFLSLAKLEGDPARLAKAQEALELALTVRTRADAEYLWADSHSGIGHVALVRHGFTKDPADLATARRHFTEAREVFAMDPDNQFARDCDVLIAECDRLQALL